ncbi:MAG: sugar ABC transporter permease, partial [Oscillospiraceae bacterium]|nr:sugar ABC transporter permease [Oscillospiraceae bacterium]
KITLPYISPMIVVNIVYTVIDSFTDTTNEVMGRLLEIQSEWRYGLSAAMAWSYFGIILVVLGIIFAIMNKLVWYDD